MKRFIASFILFFLLVPGVVSAADMYFGTVTIKDPGFAEKFKFYIDVYANRDADAVAPPGNVNAPFNLGTSHIVISYNGTALSNPILSLGSTTFSGGVNGYTMGLDTSDPNFVALDITLAGGAGVLLPNNEIRLGRITFNILNKTATSTFEYNNGTSQVLNAEGASVIVIAPILGEQELLCLPTIGGTDDINIPVGQLYSFTPVAAACANAGPLTFDVSPDPLPEWLSFDAATAQLSGTPTFADRATTTVTITATDIEGDWTQLVYDLTVGCPAEALSISNTPTTTANVGTAYQFDVDVDGGCGIVTYSMSANAPAWLQLDPITGVLSGTPAVGDVGTTEGIQITATDENNGLDSIEFNLTVSRQSSGGGGGGGGCFISTLHY